MRVSRPPRKRTCGVMCRIVHRIPPCSRSAGRDQECRARHGNTEQRQNRSSTPRMCNRLTERSLWLSLGPANRQFLRSRIQFSAPDPPCRPATGRTRAPMIPRADTGSDRASVAGNRAAADRKLRRTREGYEYHDREFYDEYGQHFDPFPFRSGPVAFLNPLRNSAVR